MISFPPGGAAVVVGASGGIGAALHSALQGSGVFGAVLGFARRIPAATPGSTPLGKLDVCEEPDIQTAAKDLAALGMPLRLFINATGYLHGSGFMPEKSVRHLSAAYLAQCFAVNCTGTALLAKHFAPLLAPGGKSMFVNLSARVGSIGDNRLGGWYGYRASKAAANQVMRSLAVELARSRPCAVCVSLHPGTVDTPMTAPFRKDGLVVRSPRSAAIELLSVLDSLQASDSGGFFDHKGQSVPW